MTTLVFLEAADDLGLQALTFARRYDPGVEVVAVGDAPQVAATVHVAEIEGYAPQAWARAIAGLQPTTVIAWGGYMHMQGETTAGPAATGPATPPAA